jgi:hypothetical protein
MMQDRAIIGILDAMTSWDLETHFNCHFWDNVALWVALWTVWEYAGDEYGYLMTWRPTPL